MACPKVPSGIYVAYIVQMLILLNAGYSVAIGDYFLAVTSFFAFSLTMVPYIVTRNAKICLPWEINLLIAVSLYLHVLGHVGNYYVLFSPYYDKFAHAVSSTTVAVLGFVMVLIVDRFSSLQLTRPMIVLFIVIFTMALGALWEIYEFAFDQFFGTTLQHGNVDTMTDLILDLIGAVIIAALGNIYLRRVPKEQIVSFLVDSTVDDTQASSTDDESGAPTSVHRR